MQLQKRLADAYPTQRALFTGENASEWKGWLLALPYADASRAITYLIAGSDFPNVHQFLQGCGFDCSPEYRGGPMKITPALAMLVAARDGGYELARDAQSPHGWRSSQGALHAGYPAGPGPSPEVERRVAALEAERTWAPLPPGARGKPVPMPDYIAERIKGYQAKLDEKRVPAVRVPQEATT